MDLHRIALHLLGPAVQALLQPRPGQRPARLLEKRVQYRELARGQGNRDAVESDLVGRRIEDQAPMLDDRRGTARFPPAQGPDPRRELFEVGGLRQ
jgi:hypothetical protein